MWIETPEVKFVDLRRGDFIRVKSGKIYRVLTASSEYIDFFMLAANQWKDGKYYGPIRGFKSDSKIVRVIWKDDSSKQGV